MLQECIDIVKDLAGNEYLYFDTAIQVKTTPHTFPFSAWGVCVSPDNRLFVMDNNEDWHEVKADSSNASLVIGSLYQRLQLMRVQYAKAS
jgi:hypothetical protein